MNQARLVRRWAKLALRGLNAYHDCGAEPDYCARFPSLESEAVVGAYQNPAGVDPAHMVIGGCSLLLIGASGERRIPYADIHQVHGPSDKAEPGPIRIALKNGREVDLPIAGRDGRFRDVYSVVRFLDRVVTAIAEDSAS